MGPCAAVNILEKTKILCPLLGVKPSKTPAIICCTYIFVSKVNISTNQKLNSGHTYTLLFKKKSGNAKEKNAPLV